MRRALAPIVMAALLAACSGADAPPPPSLSGALPGVATPGYDAPRDGVARLAMLEAFSRQYERGATDYPDHTVRMMRDARIHVLRTDRRFVKKHAAAIRAAVASALGEAAAAQMTTPQTMQSAFAGAKPETVGVIVDALRAQAVPAREPVAFDPELKTHIGRFKSRFARATLSDCRWSEMERLIGSNHDELATLVGFHPDAGYRCEVEVSFKMPSGHMRTFPVSGSPHFVLDREGEWRYFGRFEGMERRPYPIELDADILRDPYTAVRKGAFFHPDV